jgi:hypothetical protein
MLLRGTSGGCSCDGVYMNSDFVAFFLGFKYLWYLLFREQTQASENPREHTQRCDILCERQTNTASYITIKIVVISYKISRIFFFLSFFFISVYPELN